MQLKTSTFIAFAAGMLAVAAPSAAQEASPRSYAAASAQTAPVAEAYVTAYTTRDWDTLEAHLVEGASFEDPTATLVFGGIRSEGRAAMMERFRVGYASLTHMEFARTRAIIAGDVAVFEGTLGWGLDLGDGTLVDSVTPMVIVLMVKDGKVVSHRDYVDYAPFLDAVKDAREQG